MNAALTPVSTRLFLSGNEAVARAVWDAGCRVAAAYPGTPSTEILEALCEYPDLYAEWSVNEKVSLEVAFGASLAGSRAFCAMKHVGMNVASDALMTMTLTGCVGGLVIAIADDIGFSSSQNEQDSRYWGRFAHLPILEPADSPEAYAMAREAFELSERFETPVILRLTTRVCHVKSLVAPGERVTHRGGGFEKKPKRWVMVPGNARHRLPLQLEREARLRAAAETSPFNEVVDGADRRIGFIASGPAAMNVREAFPEAPLLKLGFSCPAPLEKIRAFAASVTRLVVVEETEPLLETELKAAGIVVTGKEALPRMGELSPAVLRTAVARLAGTADVARPTPAPAPAVFPRPPTLCVGCPHLGVFFALSRIPNLSIPGDIGCYALGAAQPWNALDTCVSMGASITTAIGLDKGRGEADGNKRILAVLGDSTFMHMGMPGLLDAVYSRANITVLLLDNRTVGMTGGQDNPASGRDARGNPAPRVDFAKLCEALGVNPQRIKVVNPYELPVLMKTIREEVSAPEPSVIITNQPCVLTREFERRVPLQVDEQECSGCGTCLDVGCPAITVTRRGRGLKPSGKEVDLAFTRIESVACTGCGLCAAACGSKAIHPWTGPSEGRVGA